MDYLFVGTSGEPYIALIDSRLRNQGHQTRFANPQQAIEALPTKPDAVIARPYGGLGSFFCQKPKALPAILILDERRPMLEEEAIAKGTTVLYANAIENIADRVLQMLPHERI